MFFHFLYLRNFSQLFHEVPVKPNQDTHIDKGREILQVIFVHGRVCSFQVEQIVIACFGAFQLSLLYFTLPLHTQNKEAQSICNGTKVQMALPRKHGRNHTQTRPHTSVYILPFRKDNSFTKCTQIPHITRVQKKNLYNKRIQNIKIDPHSN